MDTIRKRTRAPAEVHARILAAAADLLAEGAPLSIGSVAEAAGVTKGAVQHHFGTREALLQALWDIAQAGFLGDLDRDAGRHGGSPSGAASYLRATVRAGTRRHVTRRWRAVLAACVVERPLARQWGDWVAACRRDNAEGTQALIVRLAADGLWLSDLLGIYKLSAAERQALQDALLAGTDEPGATP
ncbi:TetR/AcrR family transcriptional regulator [Pseudorhodoferax sp.]|uniref:TetR/AcrR family transcriptional regulator n=1 Tax=Pseudorhodoferax sp. TaxID=1993553 RepID=UPI002DD66C0E|nr:TetR/AcrR family transcriptional regulator [Pseudorhodoferax sp.]